MALWGNKDNVSVQSGAKVTLNYATKTITGTGTTFGTSGYGNEGEVIRIGSIGGAMDLVVGAKEVIVTMEHVTKENKPKILKECDFPLTGINCVNKIITDIAVIIVEDKGLILTEIAEGWSTEQVQSLTEPKLIVSNKLNRYITK